MTAVDSETTQIGSWLPATGHPRWRVAVVNGANETVGTIDDLIVTPNEKVLYRLPGHGLKIRRGALQLVRRARQAEAAPRRHHRVALKSLPEFNYSS